MGLFKKFKPKKLLKIAAVAAATYFGGPQAGAAVFSGLQQIKQRKIAGKQADAMEDASAAQRAAFEATQRRADLESARNVRAAVRQARIARATVINSGAQGGTLFSSGVAGGTSSIQSQLDSNLSFFNDMGEANSSLIAAKEQEGEAMAEYGKLQGQAAESAALGNLGSSIFGALGGWKTVFGGNTGGSGTIDGINGPIRVNG